MSQAMQKNTPNVMEYYDWVAAQKFKNPEEHHQYVSSQEQDFLQNTIYPMFYSRITQFKTPFPFPMVLKDHSTRKPKYVIDNVFFTIVFFSYDNLDGEMCWEVSVHIKDHSFCDAKLLSFERWYRRYYLGDPRLYSIEMKGMPEEYLYPKLNFCSEDVEDFCIEFWNNRRDFMLFKLLDLLSH